MITDLIINSGIQYITIPLNLKEDITNKVKRSFSDKLIEQTDDGDVFDLKEAYYWSEAELFIDKKTINPEAYSRYGSLNSKDIKKDFVEILDEEKLYTVTATEALNVLEKHWVPLPYFRIRQDVENPFHHGPENWCRANIQPFTDENNNFTHQLVLAFDTKSKSIDDNYLHPRINDANDNGSERFKCVSEFNHAPAFFNNSSLWDWLYNIFWLDEAYAERHSNELRHVAIYNTFIALLHEIDAFPEIGLLSGENTIDVGLTLDIGNSRTCGLICEKSKPFESLPFDFTSARKLQLRNLSSPHLVYEDPFEMQIAFSEEKFGNPAVLEYPDVFEWPSLVRVGPEAVELTSIFESEDSQATLSSPKRYLWDNKPVKVPWIKVDTEGRLGYHDKVNIRENALYGIAEHITSSGRLIKETENDMIIAATESRYSRSSLMMLSIYEILLHAISQINNYNFRKDLGNSTYRRVLKDIVITCPTAMTVQEQHTLRKAVSDASILITRTLKGSVDFKETKIEVHPAIPSKIPTEQENNPWKFDEATCSQLAYIYGELVHKYKSNQELFFRLNGRYRNDNDTKSVNIASIDIGGGTTDFMICKYSYDEDADIPFITPKPIFWEGFNLAGDDIVKRIVEKIIIPSIHNDIEEKEGTNIVAVLNELFGQNLGGQTAKNKIYRRQFANLVASQISNFIFNTLVSNKTTQEFTIEEVLKVYGKPESGLLDYINKNISLKTNVKNYDITQVKIYLDVKDTNEGVKGVIQDILNQLSYLIAFFDCDLVLLSGRPSRLPIITEILTSNLNFDISKIINLGNYRFGNWYPFADSTGYVNDPKSTVCVGSLIAYLNQHGTLPNLKFNFKHLKNIVNTGNYFGIVDFSKSDLRIKGDDVILSPSKEKGEFKFYGEPITIGMRQLASEDWTATPLYVFDFLDDKKKAKMNKSYQFPYTIRINKKVDEGEFMSKDNIEVLDNQGLPIDAYNFNFALKTSRNIQLHWKDSGSFITRIK